MEDKVDKMEAYMKTIEENIKATVRTLLDEELSARESDPDKNWPISYP